jgi:5-methylcytosine-specific restriction endonuclease McrA
VGLTSTTVWGTVQRYSHNKAATATHICRAKFMPTELLAARKFGGKVLLHALYVREPHASSFAAAIMLQEHYRAQDEDYLEDREHKEKFAAGKMNKGVLRRVFFRRLAKQGRLFCVLCGRDDLLVRYPPRRNNPRKGTKHRAPTPDNLATIDHIVPLAEGGLKYSLRNYMCLCNKCNERKGSRSVLRVGSGPRIILNV